MSKLAPLKETSVDRASMAFNNIPGHPALHSGTSQAADSAPGMRQQNVSFGLAQPSQQHQHQLQQLQQLQMQLQNQGLSSQPHQQQPQMQYDANQIAMARQALLIQQQQQQQQQNFAFLAQQQQQQNLKAMPQNAFSGAGEPLQSTVGTPSASAISEKPGIDTSRAQSNGNGLSNGAEATTGFQAPGINILALREMASKFGIPDAALSQLTPVQLQAFLQNLQAQHMHMARLRAASEAAGVNASTPQRQTPLSAGAKAVEATARSSKSVAGDRSQSRSPALNQHGPQIFSPTALHSSLASPMGLGVSPRMASGTNTIQRMGSATSMFGEDMRATPTPSESSINRVATTVNEHVYTEEEIANAYKKSEEFLKRLPEFTSETFVPFLQKFLKENNIPGNFSKPPVFADRTIDLYRFFCEVINQGGLEQVHTRRIWRQVAKDSGLPDIPTLPPLLSRWYKVWLQPLEQLAVFPPGHPTHTGLNANFSLKKRRKNDTFGSPGSTPGPGERSYSAYPEPSKRPKTHGVSVNGFASTAVSPAQGTPPFIHSLQSPQQTHGLPPPLPIPPSGMGSAGLQTPVALPGSTVDNTTSMPTLPTNGISATHTQSTPLQDIPTVNHHITPSPAQSGGMVVPPHLARQPTANAALASSKQTVTIPPPPPLSGPALHFFPLERTLDTYGGIDINTSLALRPRPLQPSISDYGSVDIRALTLSIESGIPMEVTNALNTLIKITSHPEIALPLGQCEELAETLLGILESVKLPTHRRANGSGDKKGRDIATQEVETESEPRQDLLTYSEETFMFGETCTKGPSDGGIIGDDMQDVTAVRGLIHGSDDLWSFTSDRTLTVVYVLRNLSFLPANQQYLAENVDFVQTFVALVAKCDAAVRLARDIDHEQHTAAGLNELVSLIVLRALEVRKSLAVVLANVADRVDFHAAESAFLQATLRLIDYFVDEKQTSNITSEWASENLGVDTDPTLGSIVHVKALDGRTYYLHALEAAGRLTASDTNREAIVSKIDPSTLRPLACACSALLSGHQAALSLSPRSHISEQRLMWVQMALLVLSNLISTATPQPLSSTRRYTPLHISANGLLNHSLNNGAVAGVGAMAENSALTSAARRELTRRPMPFLPVVCTSAAIPDSLKDFRREMAADTEFVRSLFELVLQWWTQVGSHSLRARGNVPPQMYDSPLSDLAERAVYVLQLLHPDHDALFASKWADWAVDRIASYGLPPALVEVLYELVGMIPVQSSR
ncbi:hypothetical protein COEREDRAFT_86775 [Coemansia reversa NRRL 1564]|uniref:ARID domain-containing protein n=1 Tax=Coemansia reversa (strain ATCC 12441 / NRRL 1564) TaxID=763665 RepID=A0A2G5BCF3_COERN|nr:hypothetical protein COEREDRAFT_86775 [Coemansia reversa NRRL 1564]|eukprot:PIA16690.1 hypothetical protein COEREDRAFT_86775 [Coemansia reversa NRRL 1564]